MSSIINVLLMMLLCVSFGSGDTSITVDIKMAIDSVTDEGYYCTSVALPGEGNYITEFHPAMNADIVHHALLFGCQHANENAKLKYWNCLYSSICGEGSQSIVYAWAKNAPGLMLPQGVGVKVGEGSSIHHLVMQVHFHEEPSYEEDYPLLSVTLVDTPQPYVAGIYLLGGPSARLLPGKDGCIFHFHTGYQGNVMIDDITIDVACPFNGPNSIHPIAFRTHAHSRSPLIEGYGISGGEWALIGAHSPQDPQAFYPVGRDMVINKGDTIAARCHYNTTGYTHIITIGPRSSNEMCNFYIMYYTENNGIKLAQSDCWTFAPRSLSFPSPLPPPVTASDGHTHLPQLQYDVTMATNWVLNGVANEALQSALDGLKVGQITGISATSDGLYMLHRGGHVWDASSFDSHNHYSHQSAAPIQQPIIKLTLTGELVTSMGSDVFLLPHGLTVDDHGVTWITDVARHQVFQISPRGDIKTLGEKFVPGHDDSHFCKPTDIAVDNAAGHFYIGDGYCNHRVVEYSLDGNYVRSLPNKIDGVILHVPHSLAIRQDMLYVADRENGRIVVYNTTTGTAAVFVAKGIMGDRVYAITFSSPDGQWPMFAINGSIGGTDKAMGFTIDQHGDIVGVWGPPKGFTSPHDITADNGSVYVSEIGPNRIWRFTVTETASIAPTNVTMATSSLELVPALSYITSDTGTWTTCISITSDISDTSDTRITRIISDTSDTRITRIISDTSLFSGRSAATISSTGYVCPSNIHAQTNSSCAHTIYSNTSTDVTTDDGGSLFYALVIPVAVSLLLLVILVVLCMCAIRHVMRGSRKPIVIRRHYSVDPKKKLETLLRPMNKGFTKVRTYDSDTEAEDEFTVFERA